ncbi:MAG: hypothetical protein IJL02_10225 [Methanobrevibacter sp.]|uniref:hypothetical protein n=1 Tax=Methanobrevibacter sp. TaxID=66852 RepID=UPI0025EAD48E|nr:hypothetical protein [Methanobrevibacter sp.]MBQ6100219.1 hypothetical protein [Methanobrevibacter sp.]
MKSNKIISKIKNVFKAKKPHLLIAGVDMKFITPAVKYLSEFYEIEVVDFTGNKEFIKSKELKELMKWADIVFCEWMLFHTEWFSNNVTKNQKLFIRAHKYELTVDFGFKINFDNVDGVICVNYFHMELFSNIFKIPREKMFYLGNLVETSQYSSRKDEGYRNNLAIVGYMPNYKGLMRGLEILNCLKKHDDNFKLYLMGKSYKDTHWARHEEQIEYFNGCEEFIEKNNLADSVINRGWVERSEMFSNIGYVLSVSDLESFHLSPTEGFAASTNALILNWHSSEYIYPEEIIFKNTDEMAKFILDTYKDDDKYNELVASLKSQCIENYGEERFVREFNRIMNSKTSSDTPAVNFKDFKSKYYNKNGNLDKDKLLEGFKNSFIAQSEDEIKDIISKNNGKITIFLSQDIENMQINNIYQKYRSDNVLIYSLHFYENLNEAYEFIEIANVAHRGHGKLN